MRAWFRLRIFLAITVTATHLSWNSFMLTEMCTVRICTSKPGPGIDARSSPRKRVPYGFNQNNSLALSEFIQNCCIFVDYTVVATTCLFKCVCLRVNTPWQTHLSLNIVISTQFAIYIVIYYHYFESGSLRDDLSFSRGGLFTRAPL